jgi:hypothetical protein
MEYTPNPESTIARHVNEIFITVARNDTDQAVILASFVLSQPLLRLRDANQRQTATFEAYTKATERIKRQEYESQLFGDSVMIDSDELSIEPTDIERAEEALAAVKTNLQINYDLNQKLINKAVKISLKKLNGNRPQTEIGV